MRSDTLFRIASMTKPITAIGIMMLVDEGKLAVDDPVEKHLPEFRGQMLVADQSGDTITLKKPPRPITLRDLLTHTSGLPGTPPPGLAELYAKRNRTLAEAVMAYSQRPLDFEPGSSGPTATPASTRSAGSSRSVSGQSYESFLQERLFDPLGMADTTFYPTPEQLERTARHLRPQGRQAAGPSASRSSAHPPGRSIRSPPAACIRRRPDLARLYRMMLNRGALDGRRYLSESSVGRDDPGPDRRPQDRLHRGHGLRARLGRRPPAGPASPSRSPPAPTATAGPSAPRPGSTPTRAGSPS